jgi:cell division septation protein DedD
MTSRNLKNFEFKLGRQGIVLFVAGMSLLLLLVFMIGVMVGVHIDAYPEKIAKGVPEMIRRQLYHPAEKSEKAGGEETKNPRAAGENNVPTALQASLAPKTDDLKGTSLTGDKKTAPAALAPPSGSLNAPAGKNLSAPEGEGAKPAVPAPTLKEKGNRSNPSDSPEGTGAAVRKVGGKYFVQVASFKHDEEAKQFCKKITTLGYNPTMKIVELAKKGRWARVVIDGFETRDEAKKASSALSEKIKGLHCIVRPIR